MASLSSTLLIEDGQQLVSNLSTDTEGTMSIVPFDTFLIGLLAILLTWISGVKELEFWVEADPFLVHHDSKLCWEAKEVEHVGYGASVWFVWLKKGI